MRRRCQTECTAKHLRGSVPPLFFLVLNEKKKKSVSNEGDDIVLFRRTNVEISIDLKDLIISSARSLGDRQGRQSG